MQYRALGADGDFPDWVRALDGKSGAYVIREGGEVVYVGESHKGRLKQTLVRHFQRWRRRKGWWLGQFVQSTHDPGLTYDRGACTVGVKVTSAAHALATQNRLIATLRPRDNIVGQPATREPFEVF